MQPEFIQDPKTRQPPADVWIVIPIFNRREITLGCLRNLRGTGVLDWCHVVVCDGGSTDGSAEAIRSEFPEITLLEGKWWWMEGIRAGMEHAQQRGAEIYVWLNDDCHPRPGSLEALLENVIRTGHISGGITHTQDGAYSSMTKTSWGLRQMPETARMKSGEVIAVDVLVGNFVAIPRTCVDKIGLPDSKLFPHMCGDGYYTMEATAHGFTCDLVGAAQADDNHGGNSMEDLSILRGSLPLKTLWKKHLKIDPIDGLLPQLRMSRRFWGTRGWIIALAPWLKNLLSLCIRTVLPKSIRTRI